MITQIYSIQNVEEALACAKAGADRIGVLKSRSTALWFRMPPKPP